MNALTVGTLNLRHWDVDTQPERQWAVRRGLLADAIRQSGAWIVGCQESRILPAGVSQGRDVASLLGREWRVSEGGRETSTLWRADRFVMIGPSQSFPLNPSFPAVWHPNRPQLSALRTAFYDKWTGRRLLVYNLHGPINSPDHVPDGATFVQVSGEAGKTVAERANADAAAIGGADVVILGDTNSAGTLWANITSRGFLDTATQGAPATFPTLNSTNGWDPMMVGRQDGVWIDRIFVSPSFETVRAGLIARYASGKALPLEVPFYSDHFMYAATIETGAE